MNPHDFLNHLSIYAPRITGREALLDLGLLDGPFLEQMTEKSNLNYLAFLCVTGAQVGAGLSQGEIFAMCNAS